MLAVHDYDLFLKNNISKEFVDKTVSQNYLAFCSTHKLNSRDIQSLHLYVLILKHVFLLDCQTVHRYIASHEMPVRDICDSGFYIYEIKINDIHFKTKLKYKNLCTLQVISHLKETSRIAEKSYKEYCQSSSYTLIDCQALSDYIDCLYIFFGLHLLSTHSQKI